MIAAGRLASTAVNLASHEAGVVFAGHINVMQPKDLLLPLGWILARDETVQVPR